MAGRPIDEKIVAMKMDNSDFKSKAAETTSLFGKLTSALNKIPGVNLSKTTNDLNDINKAAASNNMSVLQKAVEGVSGKFSAMSVVAITALSNITNKVIDTGSEMLKSLTVEPVMDGFHEYETKIGSIATVLSNTKWNNTSLADVNAALNDLNTYSDKTIYNFGQMTQNIGRFTAAGITLGDSTTAIKGLSNLAAASGSTSDQLDSAMYQMSQALASGKLGLQDWNSLVNSGMGGKMTQDALLATAKAMGINTHQADGFRNSLQTGWLTSKVFLETLKKFGADQSMTDAATKVRTLSQLWDTLKEAVGSGWATSWELVVGNFDTATNRMTALSQALGTIVSTSAQNRNAVIKSLADAGVFQSIFTVVTDALTAIADVFQAISSGFQKAFPPANGTALSMIAKGIQTFANALVPTPAVLAKIATVSQGFFSILHAGWSVVNTLATALLNLIPPGTGAAIMSFAEYVGKLVIAFTQFVVQVATSKPVVQALSSTFSLIGTTIMTIVKGAAALGKALIDMIPSDLGTNLLNAINYVANLVTAFTTSAKAGGTLGGSAKGLGNILSDLGKIVNAVAKGITDAFNSVVKYMSGVSVSFEPVINGFKSFFSAIASGFDKFKSAVGTAFDFIKAHMPDGRQLVAGGFLTVLGTIAYKATKYGKDFVEAFKAWFELGDGIKGILDGTKEVLEGVGKSLNAFSMQVKANALLTIAFAVGVLAAAFLIMSRVKSQDIATGLVAMVGSLTALSGAMILITKFGNGKIETSSLQIVAMSVAIALMADALKKLSSLSWQEILKGMTGLAAVVLSFSGAVAIMSKAGDKKVAASALQLVAIALALKLMLGVVQDIAAIDTGSLTKGVFTMGIILLEMGAFLKLAGGSGFGIGSTLGMLAIGKAIVNITDAVNQISKIDVNNLKVGLTTIAAILAEVTLFAKLTTDSGLMSAGVGMLLVSAGITALIVPIAILGSMPIGTLVQGLMAMAVALVAVAGATMLMEGSIAAGAGLILIAAGLTALLIPILAFGNMSWATLLEGLFGLGASLLIIGGAAALLTPVIPSLVAFGLGVLSLGAGMALAGVGMILFGSGLITLAGVTATAVASIVAMIGAFIVGLASLIPTAVNFIAQVLMAIMDGLIKYGPPLIDKLATLLLELMDELGKWIPPLVDKAVEMIIKLIDGMVTALQEHGTDIVNAIMGLIGEILILIIEAGTAVINALFGWIPGVTGATKDIANTAVKTIRDNFTAGDVGHQKGKDFSSALGSHAGDAGSAGSKLGSSAHSGASSVNLSALGSTKGSDFASGLAAKIGSASSAGSSLANGGKSGAGSIDMTSTGHWFGQGFANGIGSAMGNVVSAAKNLATSAWSTVKGWLHINSPSKMTHDLGGWFGEGFAQGITSKVGKVGDSAKGMAVQAKDSLNKFLKGFELPDSKEVTFKAKLEYDKFDSTKFGQMAPVGIAPDTSTTSGLVAATKANNRQNGNNSSTVNNSNSSTNHNYSINVTAGDTSTRAGLKKLAQQIQDELKNLDDRKKMSRGEGVAF